MPGARRRTVGRRVRTLERQGCGQIARASRITDVEAGDPRAGECPSPGVVACQSERRSSELVHPAQALRHPLDGQVLRAELLQMALRPLDDQDGLGEIRGVDDGELRLCRRSDENRRARVRRSCEP